MTRSETRELLAYIASRFAASVGSGVYASVGPLIAATTFHAGPARMGLVTATGTAVNMLLRLPSSSLVDRADDERRIMAWGGLGATLATSTIPLLWLLNALSFGSFLACIALSAAMTSLVAAAGHRIIYELVKPGERARAIGLLNSAQSSGDVVGQSAGGLLIAAVAPPLAMLTGSVASILDVLIIPRRDTIPEVDGDGEPQEQALSEAPTPTRQIARTVLRTPAVIVAIIVGLAGSVVEPVVVLTMLRVAHLAPSLVGPALGLGAIGGVLGGLRVGPVVSRFALRTIVVTGILLTALGTVLLIAVSPMRGMAFVAVAAFKLLTAAGGTVIMARILGAVQEATPHAVIARTMSCLGLSLEATGLRGIAVGSWIAQATSLQAAFATSLGLYVLAVACVTSLGVSAVAR